MKIDQNRPGKKLKLFGADIFIILEKCMSLNKRAQYHEEEEEKDNSPGSSALPKIVRLDKKMSLQMTSSQYCQDLVLTRDVTMPHVTKKIFQCLDKQSLLNFRQVSQAWKNYVNNPSFWFKKLAINKTRGQEWKDVENEWKDLAKAAEKIKEMNNYFVLPLMKFYQNAPRNKYFTCQALEIVFNLMDLNNLQQLEHCPILVDFILENVKSNSEIFYDHHGRIWTDDGTYSKVRAIHLASEYGKVEVVKKLVQKVRDANFPNKLGITPMLLAVLNGKLEVVKVLAANTDHPNPEDNVHVGHDTHGCTPIDRAAYHGYLDIVKFLVSIVDTDINYDRAIECAQAGGLYQGEDSEVVKFLKACITMK